jgi:hypothetical protein
MCFFLAVRAQSVESSENVILPAGAFIQVRQVGIDAARPHVTAHLIDFWESKTDFDAGKQPIARHDVLTPWSGPHENPAARMVDILDQWVVRGNLRLKGEHRRPSLAWSKGPDLHGNLTHPSMVALVAVSS